MGNSLEIIDEVIDSEPDILCTLRTDAPPLWRLLGEGRADEAVAAAHGWLRTESHPTSALAVKVALSVAHLLAGDEDGAVVTAEGAFDDALAEPLLRDLAFLGVALQSTGVAMERGELGTLVAGTLRRLAQARQADEWVHRWATFQFHFARLLLRNRLPAIAIVAFAEVPARLERVIAGRQPDPALVALIARTDLHVTQANVFLTRAEQEVSAATAYRVAVRGYRALRGPDLEAHRFAAALAVADLHLSLWGPSRQVNLWISAAERLASTSGSFLRTLVRRAVLATRDSVARDVFLCVERYCFSLVALETTSAASSELQSAILHISASALELRELASARRWLDLARRRRDDVPADLRALMDSLDVEIALRGPSDGTPPDVAPTETRLRYERTASLFHDPRQLTPVLTDSLGRLAYALIMQYLDRQDPTQALLVFEHARAVRLAASHRRAPGEVVPPPILSLGRHVLGLAFLWDNRNARLGAFALRDGALSFHWLESSGALTPALIQAFEDVRRGHPRCASMAFFLRDHVLTAPTSTSTSLAAVIMAPQVRRIVVVPHGPLSGLPLHAAIALLRSDLTVSYAPRFFMASPARPDVAMRLAFSSLAGWSQHADDLLHEEVADCRRLLEQAGLTSTRATVPEAEGALGVGLLHVAAHGVPVGDARSRRAGQPATLFADDHPWSEAHIALRDNAGRPTRWTSRSILQAAPLRVDTVLLGCCQAIRATNPSLTSPEATSADVSWQVAFLEDSSLSITGALLAAGAGEVFAYPHRVDVRCPRAFFPALLGRYAEDRARGVASVPGDYDWAGAATAALRQVASPDKEAPLRAELHLIQHWVAPSTLERRDTIPGEHR